MVKIFKFVCATGIILAFSMAMMRYASAKDRIFVGKVIDADTKEPIEGAVVVASWLEATSTLLGDESTRFKDVKETLTNRNGEWSIVGEEGRMHNPYPYLSRITPIYYTREPEFIIFKPGYCSWPNGFSIDGCKGSLKPGGNGEIDEGKIIELPKLTNREDRLQAQSISLPGGEGALEKMGELIRLINEERKSLGLPETLR